MEKNEEVKEVRAPFSAVSGYITEGSVGRKLIEAILKFRLFYERWPDLSEISEMTNPYRKHVIENKLRAYINKPVKGYGKFKDLFLEEIRKPGQRVKLKAFSEYIFSDGKHIKIVVKKLPSIVPIVGETRWMDLNEDYKNVRKSVEETVKQFLAEGKRERMLCALIGPPGAGKTTLCYHIFEYGWLEKRIPILYTTLETLLEWLQMVAEREGIRVPIPQAKLPELIDRIINDRISRLMDLLDIDGTIDRSFGFLPGLKISGQRISEYFKNILYLDIEDVKQILREKRKVLIVDEMEVAYDKLRDLVTEKTGPLRALADAIYEGATDYLVILSFGYVSAYEIAGAEPRRMLLLSLPLITSKDISKFAPRKVPRGFANFVWWLSRGRVGWIYKLVFELWREDLKDFKDIEQLSKIFEHPSLEYDIAGISILEKNALENIIRSTTNPKLAKSILQVLIYNMAPIKVNRLQRILGVNRETLNKVLLEIKDYVVAADKLIDVYSVAKTFMADLRKIKSLTGIERYLHELLFQILSSFADEENKIVFGSIHLSWANIIFSEGYIAPLINILCDLQAELETPKNEKLTDILYELSLEFRTSGKRPNTDDIIKKFSDTSLLYKSPSDPYSDYYISVAPKLVEMIFPRFTTTPTLNMLEEIEGEGIDKQKEELSRILQRIDKSVFLSRVREFIETILEGEL